MRSRQSAWFWAGLAMVAGGIAVADDLGEIAFRQALLDAGQDLRLLCVAAHPDDEDGATLALHRFRHGVETHVAIATRGEGGQNEIGPELYEALGVIRTREMREASILEGARLHFLDLPEFGFSKTPEETFSVWGREETLRRLIRLIRHVRPHVIITHHGRLKDHGHHQAIGAALLDAFELAAAPESFPDCGSPWRPLRLYIRAWEPGADSVEVDINALDPWRGVTYAEIAAQALECHKSQGMQFFIERYRSGQARALYDLVKSAPPDPAGAARPIEAAYGPLFEGLPVTLAPDRWSISRAATPRAELAGELIHIANDSKVAVNGYDVSFGLAAAIATELKLEVALDDPAAVPGQTIKVAASARDYGKRDFDQAVFVVQAPALGIRMQRVEARFDETGAAAARLDIQLPDAAPCTLPHTEHLFDTGFLDPQIQVTLEAGEGSVKVRRSQAVYVDIAPALQISFVDAPYLVVSHNPAPVQAAISLRNNAPGGLQTAVHLHAPNGWNVAPSTLDVDLDAEDAERIVAVNLIPPAEVAPGRYSLLADAAGGTSAAAEIACVELELPDAARIGLVAAYDDTLRSTLKKLGISHEAIGPSDYNPADLDAFSLILVDMRAYQYRPDLAANNATLLEYVKRGGTLVVMYQKTFDWRSEYGPYPLRISHNRVTREDARVSVLEPGHPLFNHPNHIVETDWSGWVQERGLYFADSWDSAYTPLVSCADPGESIPPGSCLIAVYGEGTYFYTALVWYRQLRVLHPGALRLFANLLAL